MEPFTCLENIYCKCDEDRLGRHDRLNLEKVIDDSIMVVRFVMGRPSAEAITYLYITPERVVRYFNIDFEKYCLEFTLDYLQHIINELKEIKLKPRKPEMMYRILKPKSLTHEMEEIINLIEELSSL
jgi:hypothetical protein